MILLSHYVAMIKSVHSTQAILEIRKAGEQHPSYPCIQARTSYTLYRYIKMKESTEKRYSENNCTAIRPNYMLIWTQTVHRINHTHTYTRTHNRRLFGKFRNKKQSERNSAIMEKTCLQLITFFVEEKILDLYLSLSVYLCLCLWHTHKHRSK